MGLLQVTYPGKVFFNVDRAEVRSDSLPTLERFVDVLQWENANQAIVTVVGHTDANGSDSYNMDLGRRRAGNVAGELVARGFPADRIIIVSAGERQPVKSNKTENGRAENRRVEFLVSDFPQAHVLFLKDRHVNASFSNDQMALKGREVVPNQVEFFSIDAFKENRTGRRVEFVEPRLVVEWYHEENVIKFYTPES